MERVVSERAIVVNLESKEMIKIVCVDIGEERGQT